MRLKWLMLGVVYTRLLQSESVDFLAEILSTLFLDPLITYTENHVISNGRIQKILNFEEAEEEFLHEGFIYRKSVSTLQLWGLFRVQKQESSLALRFTDCARSYVKYDHTLCWWGGDSVKHRDKSKKCSWTLWGRQAGCSKVLKCSITTNRAVTAQCSQKVGLSFIRCVDEHSWEVIIAIIITASPPMGCLGSSCNHGALTSSAVRKLETWLSKELFCYLRSGTFL